MFRFLTCFVFMVTGLAFRCEAALTFNVTFQDVVNNRNVGFDDPASGATRRATLLSALNYVSSQLDPNAYSTMLDFRVNNSQTDGFGFLATAGTFWFPTPNRFDSGFFFEHATTGMDPSTAAPDGQATFDFGFNWNNELDAPTAFEVDLYSVALHEITHAMGFLSLVSPTGNSDISGGNPGVFTVYDTFLERGNGSALFGPGGNYLGNPADLVSGDVFFDGPNARAANGGNPVELFAPGAYQGGSSISHVDSNLNAIMTPTISLGVTEREWTDIDRGILRDIGWQFVPEPNAAAALVSLLCCNALFRRRRIPAD